jgi:threonyl-tRNA synthetase
VGEDNSSHRPVVIHRAVSGSLERFIAILIEHFAGAFPVWLAPEQVRVLPITNEYGEYAAMVTKRLHDAGVRVHLDARSETLKYRVAEGARMKVPYMCVIGRREAEADQVAVNTRGAGEGQKPAPVAVDEFIARVKHEVETKALTLSAGARPD